MRSRTRRSSWPGSPSWTCERPLAAGGSRHPGASAAERAHRQRGRARHRRRARRPDRDPGSHRAGERGADRSRPAPPRSTSGSTRGSGLIAGSRSPRSADLPGWSRRSRCTRSRSRPARPGAASTGATVTLVGLQDSSAALRSVSVVAGRLPLPGSTSEVAIDQGLSTALTGGVGSPIQIGQKIQMITATGPDLFTVVGFTAGTERRAVLHPRRRVRRRRGDARAVRARAAHAAGGAALRARRHRGGGVERGPRQVRRGGDHLRSARGRRRAAAGPRTAAGARHRAQPDRRRRGDRQQRGALAAFERRREIGLLRAAGASSRQVFRLFAVEVATVASRRRPDRRRAGGSCWAPSSTAASPRPIWPRRR